MALNIPVKITYHEAAHYTKGRTQKIRAIVNHRMVGTVAGTRAYFVNPATRPVSTHFGIGKINGRLVIDQYVPLDDTAYGNGNYDASGRWDDWGYGTTEINARTISIEHQDHGDPAGQGVVSEDIQQASIALQALLLRGTTTDWLRAGIIIRDPANRFAVMNELNAINPKTQTIITHNDIAGNLKPYCWRPWKFDAIGFPRNKYINGILDKITPPVVTPTPAPAPLPTPIPVPPPTPVIAYTQAQVDGFIKEAKLPLELEIQALKLDVVRAGQEVKSKAIAYIHTL